MYGDDVVYYYDKEYLILYSNALFASGFNVYQRQNVEYAEDGTDKVKQTETFNKINDAMSWFTTYEAALEFINEKKSRNKDFDSPPYALSKE